VTVVTDGDVSSFRERLLGRDPGNIREKTNRPTASSGAKGEEL
jgi:hypothetical protein